MKQLLVLLCICSFAATNSVSAQEANIMIFSPKGAHFYVSLDGRLQHSSPEKSVRITEIPEGNYSITIEFYNKETSSIKLSTQLRTGKETSFMIQENEDKGLHLNEYSSVPIAQVGSSSGSTVVEYSRESLNKKEGVVVNEQPDIYRSKGGVNTNGVSGDYVKNRMGQTKITTHTDSNGNTTEVKNDGNDTAEASPAPNPNDNKQDNSNSSSNNTNVEVTEKEQTTERTEVVTYEEEVAADGTKKIVRKKHITVKTTFEQNGVQMSQSRKFLKKGTTRYNCLPKGDEEFAPVKAAIKAASDRLAEAKNKVQDQCVAPEQLVAIFDLLEGDAAKADFASFAKPFCADPWEYPLEKYITTAANDTPEPKEEPKVEPTEEPKTDTENSTTDATDNANSNTEDNTAELSAKELKALAKAKAKEEKAKAKEAKKKAKEEAKRKKAEAKAK